MPVLLSNHPTRGVATFLFNGNNGSSPGILLTGGGGDFVNDCMLKVKFAFSSAGPRTAPVTRVRHLVRGSPHGTRQVFPCVNNRRIGDDPARTCRQCIVSFFSEDRRRT